MKYFQGTISAANRVACPVCNASARRVRPNWWQRLFGRKKYHYHCYTCGRHFAYNG